MTQQEQIQVLVKEAINKIIEHCDAVQVLVTFHDEDGTKDLFEGRGNYYARVGMAQEYLSRDKAQTLAVEIAKESEEGE